MADIAFPEQGYRHPKYNHRGGGYDAPRRQITAQGRQKD